jgi:putative hydrolase of the HAD superfamily
VIRSVAAPATVFVDADNTLWDTDSVFADAQLNMLERIEAATGAAANTDDRLTYVRAVDQAIAERHHARLRYPPRLLVRGLEAALAGHPADRAARVAWRSPTPNRLPDVRVDEIEQAFFVDLRHQPELRPGVREGLEALRAADCVVLIVTEGPRAKVEETIKSLALHNLITRIIAGPKRPELYQRVLRLMGAPKRAFMVGDQLDRDIAPAKAAGLKTIYFPGGFQPRWALDEAHVRPDYVIGTFAEVPDIVLAGGGPSAEGLRDSGECPESRSRCVGKSCRR